MSHEEIPDTLEIKSGQYFVEKQPIACGTLVNNLEDEALPTLHCALEIAFLKPASVLLIIGAVCSVISKRNNLCVFFYSHSHSSSDGTSILMLFSCLEDLIAYLYAFYVSMRIDLTVQFDLLIFSIRKKNNILVVMRNSQRIFLKPTFMIKLCDNNNNRKLSLQRIRTNPECEEKEEQERVL